MRAWLLPFLLALAGAFVVVGVGLLSTPAAWITAGVLLAAWSVLMLTEVRR